MHTWPALGGSDLFAEAAKDILERMANGHPMCRIDDFLPWNWKPSNVTEEATCEKWTLTKFLAWDRSCDWLSVRIYDT
jgi:hypothetical protein